ncbi:MAG: glycerophosphodiester phosphodiesterase family protein, partial [Alkalispirochaeta sp.]
ISAFELAAETPGIAGVELDVQIARDGEVVVAHDGDLQRLAGDPRRIVEVPSAELATVPLHGTDRYGQELTTVGVPTLNTVIDTLPSWMKIDIELKSYADTPRDAPERVARLLADRGGARPAEREGADRRVRVSPADGRPPAERADPGDARPADHDLAERVVPAGAPPLAERAANRPPTELPLTERIIVSSFDPRLIRRFRREMRRLHRAGAMSAAPPATAPATPAVPPSAPPSAPPATAPATPAVPPAAPPAATLIPTAVIYSEDQEVPWFLRAGLGVLFTGSEIAKPSWRTVLGGGRLGLLGRKRPQERAGHPDSRRRVDRPHRPAGWSRVPLYVWTVNEEEVLRDLMHRGVAGVIGDDPEELVAWATAIAERSAAPDGDRRPGTRSE